jgi:hypothetical protein
MRQLLPPHDLRNSLEYIRGHCATHHPIPHHPTDAATAKAQNFDQLRPRSGRLQREYRILYAFKNRHYFDMI